MEDNRWHLQHGGRELLERLRCDGRLEDGHSSEQVEEKVDRRTVFAVKKDTQAGQVKTFRRKTHTHTHSTIVTR